MNSEKKKQEKILIVDDVEVNRAILEQIIENMGVQPILAENGEQALALALKEHPHLILTDISMPGMDGYELCKALKKKEITRDIPIIFISAYDNPQNIVEGLSMGGEDYITKPFVEEEVRVRVGVRLRLYEENRELMEMNRRLQVSVNEQLKQIEQEKKNILYALANIATQDANYEEEYFERLSRNCRILALAMQLSPVFETKISDTFIEILELAALLCDIGDFEFSKKILQKDKRVKNEEKETMQDHTNAGARFLRDICGNNDRNDFVGIVADVAHYHHENWDGSGYPDGLKKEEIPLGAQIVAVMARYCTLTGKESHSREEALAMMEEESGIKFNPEIFKICRKISPQLS